MGNALIEWKVWKSLPTLKLWEAVALVYEVDPRSLTKSVNSSPGDPQFEARSFPTRDRWQEFQEDLYFAARAAATDDAPILIRAFLPRGSKKTVAEVHLADVVAFFLRRGTPPIPKELREITPQTSGGWPWGAHHTEDLGHLEAAAKKWWTNFDPSEPDTAPTNSQVANWLVNERGVSEKKAGSIASILRPASLKPGRR